MKGHSGKKLGWGLALVALLPLSAARAQNETELAGVALAVAIRRRAPLAAAVPYAVLVARESVGWRRWAPLVAATAVASDLVGAGALVAGSIRSRSPVL